MIIASQHTDILTRLLAFDFLQLTPPAISG
jgi:hypothetical protein